MLRKFNATHLSQGSIERGLLDMDCVDLLQGLGKNTAGQADFNDSPEYLKFDT